VTKYEQYLKCDDLISHHLDLLYDKMLEANLLKIIQPYRLVDALPVCACLFVCFVVQFCYGVISRPQHAICFPLSVNLPILHFHVIDQLSAFLLHYIPLFRL
jgi:hypothetical protein